MQKIPTLLQRNPDDRAHVTDAVTPGCEWVLAGEGVATRKYDGTCVMLDDDGQWWARREVKPGKASPAGFIEVNVDEVTGKRMGWEPIAQSSFAKFHAEALVTAAPAVPGTYELVGPKINGNPEGTTAHALVSHADAESFRTAGVPRTVPDLVALVAAVGRTGGWEGIVWHHPDGRMAKLKARDLA